MTKKQKVSVCFWFNTEAEDAAQFYVSLFEDSRITGVLITAKEGLCPKAQCLP